MATSPPLPSPAPQPGAFSDWIKWGNNIAGYAAVIAVVIGFLFAQKAIQENEKRISEIDKKADDLNGKLSLLDPRLTQVGDKVNALTSDVNGKADSLNAKIASIDDKVKKLTSLGKYLDDPLFLNKVLDVFAEVDKKDSGKLFAFVNSLEPRLKDLEGKLTKNSIYEIVNVHNGKLLDMAIVEGDPDGAKIQIYSKTGQGNQRWKLVKLD